MSDEFDAAAAAARATGAARDSAEDGAENHAAAEGADATPDVDVGSDSTIREILFSTDPSPSLRDVEDPYDPELGGTARIYRGIMKMTGVDGLPAIADIAIGAIEATQEFDFDTGGDEDQEQQSEQTEENTDLGGVDFT